MQARQTAHLTRSIILIMTKYTFAEISVKTIRLHESSPQALDAPNAVREMWENYVTKSDWFDPDKEALVVFLLNTQLKCTGFNLVSLGTLNETSAHAREVFRAAIAGAAYGLIIAHNHPSGDPTPSDADRRFTRRMKEAGEIVGIKIMDHVVVGDGRHFSFREHGML